ncbi:MAG: hypothetical protein M1269_08535 [Chloroflexi bacterium]|nr:hypothetical protein [Chloroflexota bacterium]
MIFVFKIIALSLLWVIVLFLLLRFGFAHFKKKLRQKVEEKFNEEDIILRYYGANFFGRKSKGVGQLRGNGALVLTRNELWFFQGITGMEISIPLKNIKSITFPKSFLGKTIFRPLLCVEYISDEGEDSIAWAMPDPENWKEAIERAKPAA